MEELCVLRVVGLDSIKVEQKRKSLRAVNLIKLKMSVNLKVRMRANG